MKTTRTIERGANKGQRVTVDHTNVALLRMARLCIDRYNARQAGPPRDMASGQMFSGAVHFSPGLPWLLQQERGGYIDPTAADREAARQPRRGHSRFLKTFVDEDYLEGYEHNAVLAEIALVALNYAADDDTDAGTSDQLQGISERLEGELDGIRAAIRKLAKQEERRSRRARRNGKGKRSRA